MEIVLDKRAVKQIRLSAQDAVEEGDTEALREDILEAFTEVINRLADCFKAGRAESGARDLRVSMSSPTPPQEIDIADRTAATTNLAIRDSTATANFHAAPGRQGVHD